jgi:hypothetical protein
MLTTLCRRVSLQHIVELRPQAHEDCPALVLPFPCDFMTRDCQVLRMMTILVDAAMGLLLDPCSKCKTVRHKG